MTEGQDANEDGISSFHIRVADEVVDTMVANALEAYCLGDGKPRREKLETFGYLWGYQYSREGVMHIHVDRALQSLSAKRSTDSVLPNPKAHILLNEVSRHIMPSRMLLGHFHTHPYIDLPDMRDREAKAYEFSTQDHRFMVDKSDFNDIIWEESNGVPICLVVTVTELQHIHDKRGAEEIATNIWKFDIGQYRFWLNAMVGALDLQRNRTTITDETDRAAILLDIGVRGVNSSSGRFNFNKDRRVQP